MRSRKSKTLATLVVAGLAVAACGSDDDGADGSSSDATTADGSASDGATSDLEGTLRVLIHQNPPGVEFMTNFNDEFEAANPGVTIDMSVVNADDIPTVNQTRLNAGDIDVTTISMTGFANPVQPYMEGRRHAVLAAADRGRAGDGPDRPAVRPELRPGGDRRRLDRRLGLLRSISAARSTAACS
jgi:hypothetical protein